MAIRVSETSYGKWKIPAMLAAVIIVIVCVFAGILLKDSTGIDMTEATARVEIADGDGMDITAANLKAGEIIKYPSLFKLYAKLGGYENSIQPGAATITNHMSYNEILELLITPNRETTKVVIPEGYEIKQIAERLCELGLVTWNDFYAALNPSDYDYRFLQGIPERENKLEGYLFPATYEIPAGMSAHDIIDLMLAAFDNQFAEEYYTQAAQYNMTVDQIITMASIVERETDAESERAKVAGVFYNRINSGMKLQSCATVQYILGERKPVLTIADTQIDSPYNTYLHGGFPLGPICNPGIECIKAALYPEVTDAYYFVLGKNGQHVFSHTYEEHLAAMKDSDPTMSVDSSAIENQDSMRQ